MNHLKKTRNGWPLGIQDHLAVILKISSIRQPLQCDQTTPIFELWDRTRTSIYECSVQNNDPLILVFGTVFNWRLTWFLAGTCCHDVAPVQFQNLWFWTNSNSIPLLHIAPEYNVQNTFFVDPFFRWHFRILSKFQKEPSWSDHLDVRIWSNIKEHQRLVLINTWLTHWRSNETSAKLSSAAWIIHHSLRVTVNDQMKHVWICRKLNVESETPVVWLLSTPPGAVILFEPSATTILFELLAAGNSVSYF
jgi:hypothetical protein